MNFSKTLKKLGIDQTVDYLYKDSETNMRKLIDWADRFSGREFAPQRASVRQAIECPEHPSFF